LNTCAMLHAGPGKNNARNSAQKYAAQFHKFFRK
jgi:hypothetical protein